MPRISPPPIASFRAYMTTLGEAAAGLRTLDESKLTSDSQKYMQIFRNALQRHSLHTILSTLPTTLPDHDKEIDEALVQYLEHNDARILCLSETPTNNAMWANYAMNATGCVLGFRPTQNSWLDDVKQVRYFDELPVLGSGVDLLLYGHTAEMTQRSMDVLGYSKKAEWGYEKEWRILLWAEEKDDALYSDYLFNVSELESVTFGVRISKITEDAVRVLVAERYLNCQLYRMVVKGGETVRLLA